MESSDWVAPLVAAAVAFGTSVATYYVQRQKLRHELRTEFMAESAIVRLLEHPQWKRRSFSHIKARLGGFGDDELRRLLVRAGAVSFHSNDIEWWGLLKRNGDIIDVKEYDDAKALPPLAGEFIESPPEAGLDPPGMPRD